MKIQLLLIRRDVYRKTIKLTKNILLLYIISSDI